MILTTRTTLTPRALILTFLLGFATLSGCVFPGVYKLNVQQGNIVTQDMLDKLRPGMTERQVIYVMGNPVLESPYDPKHWDYIYTLEERDVITQHYHIRVFFNENRRYTHYTGELPKEEIHERDQLKTLPVDEQAPSNLDGLYH